MNFWYIKHYCARVGEHYSASIGYDLDAKMN